MKQQLYLQNRYLMSRQIGGSLDGGNSLLNRRNDHIHLIRNLYFYMWVRDRPNVQWKHWRNQWIALQRSKNIAPRAVWRGDNLGRKVPQRHGNAYWNIFLNCSRIPDISNFTEWEGMLSSSWLLNMECDSAAGFTTSRTKLEDDND